MHISGLVTIRVHRRVTSMQTGSQDETDLQLTGSIYAAIPTKYQTEDDWTCWGFSNVRKQFLNMKTF